jgi:hypothetical protein
MLVRSRSQSWYVPGRRPFSDVEIVEANAADYFDEPADAMV